MRSQTVKSQSLGTRKVGVEGSDDFVSLDETEKERSRINMRI